MVHNARAGHVVRRGCLSTVIVSQKIDAEAQEGG